jgi:hypothetical protein
MTANDELDAAVTAIRSHVQTGAGVIRSWSLSRLLAGYDRRGQEIDELRRNADAALQEFRGLTEDTRPVLAELDRLRKVEKQVADLASEWDRFGLKGPAQRLRLILGEVTS